MIKTGCKILDEFLEGYKEELTMIYGPAASGKTTIAKLAVIGQVKEGKKVLFLDTENGFSVERFKQLAGKDYGRLLGNVFLISIKDFNEQCERIENLMKIADMFSLIIVDTIGALYRKVLKDDIHGTNKAMDRQLGILSELARKGVPVIVTNQVYTDFDKKEISSVGGDMFRNWSKCLIELKKDPRKIVLKKPEEREMEFDIKEKGIFKVE